MYKENPFEVKTDKVIKKFLELQNKIANIDKELGWWQTLDEDTFMKTLQNMFWDNGLDWNVVKWHKFLNGEYIPSDLEQ